MTIFFKNKCIINTGDQQDLMYAVGHKILEIGLGFVIDEKIRHR
jgi:hypothetical protein